MNCFSENYLQPLETEVPNIQHQLFNDQLNPDITGTFDLFTEGAMLSEKIPQFINKPNTPYSDKAIEYTEPLKPADNATVTAPNENLDLQSKEINSTTEDLGFDNPLIKNQSDPAAKTVKCQTNWVSRCGIFCSLCKTKFLQKAEFDSHFSNAHPETKLLYTCSICNEENGKYEPFRNHCYRHFVKGRIKCSLCPTIRFTQDKHLQAHTKLFHSDKEPQKNSVTVKEPTETRENVELVATFDPANTTEIFCNKKCKQVYKGKKFFDDHFLVKHPHSAIIYTCKMCYDDFEDFGDFEKHSKILHDKITFSCSKCPASFKRKKCLQIHMNTIHSQESEMGILLNNENCASQQNLPECRNTNKTVQKSISNVDNDGNCTNLGNFVDLINISDKFSSDENQNIDLQGNFTKLHGYYKEDGKADDQSWRCSQSMISESDISDLISNLDDVESCELDHIGSWQNNPGLLCGRCGQKFSAKSALHAHFQQEHPACPVIYVCSLCKTEFDHYNRFKDHCYRHFIKGRFKCCYCSQSFPKLNRLLGHMKSVHPKSYLSEGQFPDSSSVDLNWQPPSIQSIDTSYSSELRSDSQSVGAEDRRGSWLTRYGIFCCKCKMKFWDKPSFQTHYTEHHSVHIIYTCSLCSRQYDTYKCFSNHCLRHFNRNSYKCTVCPLSFAKYRTLSAHMKTNRCKSSEDISTFPCNICNKVYLTRDKLNQHSIASPCARSDRGSSSTRSPAKSDLSRASSVDMYMDSSTATTKSDYSLQQSSNDDAPNMPHPNQSLQIYNSNMARENTYKNPGDECDKKSFNWLSVYGFMCMLCKQRFPKKKYFDEHFEKLHPQSEVTYTCSICTNKFKHYRSFISHAYRHFIRGRYKCQYCPLYFSHDNQLQAHSKAFARDRSHNSAIVDPEIISINDDSGTKPFFDSSAAKHALSDENHNDCTLPFEEDENFEIPSLEMENIEKIITNNILKDTITNSAHYKNDGNVILNFEDKEYLKDSSLEIMCRLCQEKLPSKEKYDQHFEAKHNGWHHIYTCPICKKTEHDYSNFIKHKCTLSNNFRSSLKTDARPIRSRPILCRKCDEKFVTKLQIGKHYKEIHPNCKLLYCCPLCAKDFENYQNFRNHRYLHSVRGKYKCHICSKSFAKNCRLVRHFASSHTDTFIKREETSFSCTSCTETFLSESELNSHSISCQAKFSDHNREAPISCHYCNKAFTHPADSKNHSCIGIKSEMCWSPADKYFCMTCDRSFQSLDEQEAHSIACSSRTNKAPSEDLSASYQQDPDLVSGVRDVFDQLTANLENTRGGRSGLDSLILCAKCKRTFPNKLLYEAHCKEKHCESEVVYTCAVCDREYKTYHSFRNHRYRHFGRFKCSMCPSRFSLQSGLWVHLRERHGRAELHFQCPLCHKTYRTEPGLKLHIRSRHTDSAQTFSCQICGIVLHSKNGLFLHMESHKLGMRFMCHMCGHLFCQKSNLQSHMRRACLVVGKRGAIPPSAKGARGPRVQCVVCKVWCRDSAGLRHHAELHRGRTYRCAECGKRFISPARLRQHSYSHMGLRPHHCPHCPKTFTNFPNLLKHNRRRHKPFHLIRDPDKESSLYDKNWVQPAISALDDSIQSVIITSENLKHSVIKKKCYEVKSRNNVSCSKMRTESPPVADKGDISIRLYNHTTGDTLEPGLSVWPQPSEYHLHNGLDLHLDHNDILPCDGLQTINMREITLDNTNRNNHSTDVWGETQSNTDLYDTKLTMQESTVWELTENLNSDYHIDHFQNEIIKELAEKIDFLDVEELPPNIGVIKEIETEEILSRKISIQQPESSHCRKIQKQAELNHAFDPSPGQARQGADVHEPSSEPCHLRLHPGCATATRGAPPPVTFH